METKKKLVVTHKIPWSEVAELIANYISEKHEIKIPDGAQIRVLNEKEVMVNPHSIRIKYESEVGDGGRKA